MSPSNSVTSSAVAVQDQHRTIEFRIAGQEERIQHHPDDRREALEGRRLPAGELEAHLGAVRESGDEGAFRIEPQRLLEVRRERGEEAVIVHVELRMERVVDIPESRVELIAGPVRKRDHESTLVGHLTPAVVVQHVVVTAAVAVQGEHQRCGLRQLRRGIESIPAE